MGLPGRILLFLLEWRGYNSTRLTLNRPHIVVHVFQAAPWRAPKAVAVIVHVERDAALLAIFVDLYLYEGVSHVYRLWFDIFLSSRGFLYSISDRASHECMTEHL